MNRWKQLGGAMIALGLLTGTPATGADLPPLAHGMTQLTPKPAAAIKLQDINGKLHDLAQYKGRVVLVNFWATWCPPCRREMPSMERLAQQLKGEPFAVLAVNVGENADMIGLFTSQLETELSFPILLDRQSKTMQAWKVGGLPTTYLVDKQGRVVGGAIGGREFDHPEMVKAIRAVIKQ
ncbi:MAG: TlpA family protein disulfide reductase [Thiobacillus sp.]|nr:TlpA family protein disulfide reductase [Thiobacillus sp.]